MLRAVKRFGELMAPGRLDAISVDMIEQYVAKRSEQRGQKQESKLAIQTINKDLRHLKAALNRAVAWGWLPKLPKIKMLKAPKKLPRFVTPEHFAAIYQACDKATRAGGNCDPADWWRALIVFAYMTGWRIGECLAVRRADVDLDAGTAITRAEDNKAGRDEIAPLHPLVVEHLRLIPGFSVTLFDWPFYDRALWEQFGDIQRAAGINLDCHEQHEHTPSCHVYGFHDLRRGFATQNAPLLPAIELQARMRHVSFQTTQEYINLANQLAASTDRQFVPSLKVKAESA
jgi:integrase